MSQFANTEYLNFEWLILIGILFLWLFARWRRKRLQAMADTSALDTILPGHKSMGFLLSGGMVLLTIGFLILALANPVGAAKPVKGQKKGLDIVLALDVSKSMDAQDLKPSRLQRAIQLISNLNEKLAGNRIGLVVFAGKAFVQMPLTTDAAAIKLFLGNINTTMLSDQGTAIGDAIETSQEMLFPNGSNSGIKNSAKVILLLTDGETHDNDAIEKAKEASRKGIEIFTIGVGSEEGAPIPVYVQGILQNYLKDENDQTVVSKLDPVTLKEIATSAHGYFYRMSEQEDIISSLVNKINTLQKGEQDFEIFDLNQSMFQWFAGAALFLLLLESILKFRNARMIAKEQK